MGYKVSMNISNLLQINYIYIYILFYIADLVWDCAVIYMVTSVLIVVADDRRAMAAWNSETGVFGEKAWRRKVRKNFILIILDADLHEMSADGYSISCLQSLSLSMLYGFDLHGRSQDV